jgi:hypothetical protein
MNTLKMSTNKYPKRHLLKTCYTSETVAAHVKGASLEDLYFVPVPEILDLHFGTVDQASHRHIRKVRILS